MGVDPRDARARYFQDKKETKHEEDAVTAVLNAFRVSQRERTEIHEVAEHNRRQRPITADLREYYSASPLFIVAVRPSELIKASQLWKWFPSKKAVATPLLQQYFTLWEMFPATSERERRPLTAIVPWPRMSEVMVLHPLPYDVDVPGVRLMFNLKVPRSCRLTLEPLSQFVELLASSGVTTLR